jgi:DNA-binding transcriptional regulator YhcF (GntR family)
MTAAPTTGKPRRKVSSGLAMKTLGRAPNLPSQVAHMISDEILAGRFQAGDQLPTERELAETFGVSRNVVREAIARLRFEGAVEPRQGSGVFVLGNQANSALRLDAEILRDRSLFTRELRRGSTPIWNSIAPSRAPATTPMSQFLSILSPSTFGRASPKRMNAWMQPRVGTSTRKSTGLSTRRSRRRTSNAPVRVCVGISRRLWDAWA